MLTSKQLGQVFTIGSIFLVLSSTILLLLVGVDDNYITHENASDFLFVGDSYEEARNNSCPANTSRLENFAVHGEKAGAIPKRIHILVPSKCVSKEQAEHLHLWKLNGYSLEFHDEEAASLLLSKPRKEFPSLRDQISCIFDSMFRTEIVKLLLLWDYGGVVVDENTAPGDILRQSNMIRDTDDALILFRGDSPMLFYTYFMAASSEHPVIYMLIQKTCADIFMQYTDRAFVPSQEQRKGEYLSFISKHIFYNRTGMTGIRSVYEAMNRRITLVNITSYDTNSYFRNSTTQQPISLLSTLNYDKYECLPLPWNTQNGQNTMESLLRLVQPQHVSCPDGLYYIQDVINYDSVSQRWKIPKIIHFTSKTRCVTKVFADNIKSWHFDGYSIFLHDDGAVKRLLSENWSDFPLLKDAVNCITSGGGFADIWRYLIIWEYGGIYTDIDNIPGPWLGNGTIIKDTDDAFFEIEAAKFPSQYFFASSPRHPVMYMTIQNTIQRLLTEQNIVRQYVPFVTGPGALKWGIHYTIGNAYVIQGSYPTFDSQRSITLVGNRTTAMRRNYINRGIVPSMKDEYAAMNMTHYHFAGRQTELPQKACLEILHEMNLQGKYSKLLGLNRLAS
jgi:Mannosyltransferase OCH1 and related enzymes